MYAIKIRLCIVVSALFCSINNAMEHAKLTKQQQLAEAARLYDQDSKNKSWWSRCPLFNDQTLILRRDDVGNRFIALVKEVQKPIKWEQSKESSSSSDFDTDDFEIAQLSNKDIPTLYSFHENILGSYFDKTAGYFHGEALTKIDVSYNQLHELPLCLITQSCPYVKKIDASHNAISYVSVEGAKPNSSLAKIILHHNNLESFDFGTLFAHYRIKSVDVSHNHIQDLRWDSLCSKLTYCPRIDLRGNPLPANLKDALFVTYGMCRWKDIESKGRINPAGMHIAACCVMYGSRFVETAALPSILGIDPLSVLGGALCACGLVLEVKNFFTSRSKEEIKQYSDEVRTSIIFDTHDMPRMER